MQNLAELARHYNPPLENEQLSRSGDPQEEARLRKVIEHSVTNPDGSIYALTLFVPELFAALLKARYSRTELSARQLLAREFVDKDYRAPWGIINAAQNSKDKLFNYKRGEEVAERILLQFGDDSAFEVGGAHLFLDRVSMPASKIIEDARIGLSPIEKSTRFVVFDQKGTDGDYSFFKDPKVMESDHQGIYLDATRNCFDFYAKGVAQLQGYFRQQVPIGGQKFADLSKEGVEVPFNELSDDKSIRASKAAYNQSVRAKACDVARVLLPASTLTNIGEFGNARAYGYLMTKMMASPLAEMQMIATEATAELKKVLPKFLDIVDNDRGQAYQNYLRQTEDALQKRAKDLLQGEKPDQVSRVELVKMDESGEINIAAGLLYPYSNLPLRQLIDILKGADSSVVGDILHDSLKFRTNRRHKPPRAFEVAGYELVFDILGNFGIFRDLHRQRTLTQQRQIYTTEHGYDMPVEFEAVGLEQEFVTRMQIMDFARSNVAMDFPAESQYLTTLANYTRWYMGMNLREAFWMAELRSTPQGHFSYRTVVQDMFIKAQDVYPFLKNLASGNEQYVDMSDRSKNLERMEAMKKIETRLAAIEDKYS